MTPRAKRFVLVAVMLGAVAVAIALVASAFRSNLVFFYSPSDIAAQQAPAARTFRLGGLVESGSVVRGPDGVTLRFVVTDTVQRVPVEYKGLLPDLFKEGKGVVAQGKLGGDGVFRADEVLAKHDENYMPPEAANAVERAHKANAKATQTLKP
ncbi:MAG TPA: cytochrome c maturation protein CcmE [Burkholderiaceae bacterium]|nr:cytochrome c maturation protein CcmE [Burkholderiaceae bacterium]